MMTNSNTLWLLRLWLAAILIVTACGKHEFEDIFGPAFEPSSSSSENSSSSIISMQSSSSVSSSSSASLNYDGKTYKFVQIGTQIWMAENLNYAVEGSKCYGNLESNCGKYGRLYDWATAMAFDFSCNEKYCATQVSARHQGICPAGWYIPSNADWDKLIRYADGSTGTYSPHDSDIAGKYLKSKEGWWSNGNGEDTYGFTALPGGYGVPLSDFYYVGNCGDPNGCFKAVEEQGFWWSASEYSGDYDRAYSRFMNFSRDYAQWSSYSYKTEFRSVRCFQDIGSSSSSSSCTAADNTETEYCSNGTMKTYGLLDYESQIYKTVQIGTQTWMAENLNYAIEGSRCYGNLESNCDKNGRLYNWASSMDACPEGWRLPSSADWDTLIAYIHADNRAPNNATGATSTIAGRHLKAMEGWDFNGNGMDTYGFAALPGGYGDSSNRFFYSRYGYWWSATESNASDAYYRQMRYNNGHVDWGNFVKTELRSVRCVQIR
jgi:uncharacterized protein (TIGR02145 family)